MSLQDADFSLHFWSPSQTPRSSLLLSARAPGAALTSAAQEARRGPTGSPARRSARFAVISKACANARETRGRFSQLPPQLARRRRPLRLRGIIRQQPQP